MSGIPLISFERDVWNWVRDKRWLRRVCTYVSPVLKEGSIYQLHEDDKIVYLKGLTTLMKEALWADGAPKHSAAEKHVVQLHRQTAARTRITPMELKGRHAKLTGVVRGMYIHRQIENYVRLTEEEFKNEYPEGMHPWAALLLREMLALNWRPFKAEFKVHDKEMGVGYSIDLMAVTQDGIILEIETKTGHSGGLFHTDTSWQWLPDSPFAGRGWPCTPRNRAIVQQLIGGTMAANNLRLPAEAYRLLVAHVDNMRVAFTEVTHELLVAEAPPLFIYLRQVRALLRIKKKRKEEKSKAVVSSKPRQLFQ